MSQKRSPFVVLSQSLSDIDRIFNSKRDVIVQSLRDGNKAWEARKQKYEQTKQVEGRTLSEENASVGKRARTRLSKDSDYPSELTIEDLLRVADDNPREREVRNQRGHAFLHRLGYKPPFLGCRWPMR